MSLSAKGDSSSSSSPLPAALNGDAGTAASAFKEPRRAVAVVSADPAESLRTKGEALGFAMAAMAGKEGTAPHKAPPEPPEPPGERSLALVNGSRRAMERLSPALTRRPTWLIKGKVWRGMAKNKSNPAAVPARGHRGWALRCRKAAPSNPASVMRRSSTTRGLMLKGVFGGSVTRRGMRYGYFPAAPCPTLKNSENRRSMRHFPSAGALE